MWGFTGSNAPPEALSGVIGILKYGGAGGSHFVQSIPDSLILNFDLTPTVHHPQRAMIWPYVFNNQTLEPDPDYPGNLAKAKSVKMVWDNFDPGTTEPRGVMAKVAALVEAARENKPRPKAVVFDTVDMAFQMIMPCLTARFGKKEFSDIGEAGWTRRNLQFWDRLFWPLKWAGYTIVLVMQIYDEPKEVTAPDGKGRITKEYPNTPLLPERTFKMLVDACNVCGKIEAYDMVSSTPPYTKKPGRKMIFRSDAMVGKVKARAGLPDSIDISGQDPWKKFATAWDLAAKSDIEKATP
jgi:hypothetical protein